MHCWTFSFRMLCFPAVATSLHRSEKKKNGGSRARRQCSARFDIWIRYREDAYPPLYRLSQRVRNRDFCLFRVEKTLTDYDRREPYADWELCPLPQSLSNSFPVKLQGIHNVFFILARKSAPWRERNLNICPGEGTFFNPANNERASLHIEHGFSFSPSSFNLFVFLSRLLLVHL